LIGLLKPNWLLDVCIPYAKEHNKPLKEAFLVEFLSRELLEKQYEVLLIRKTCTCGVNKEGVSKHPLKFFQNPFSNEPLELPVNCPQAVPISSLLSSHRFSKAKFGGSSETFEGLFDLMVEEFSSANIDELIKQYKLGSSFEVFTDRLKRYYRSFFEGKRYEEIDDLHGDSSSETYISRIKSFLEDPSLNKIKERFSERFVHIRLAEAFKTISLFSFSDFAFIRGSCETHRLGKMASDLCIHYQGKHFHSLNVKMTWASPTKPLRASPEKDFRPCSILNINVSYRKKDRGATVSFATLAGNQSELSRHNIPLVTEKDVWGAIAEKIIRKGRG